jgi:hypothetical protein
MKTLTCLSTLVLALLLLTTAGCGTKVYRLKCDTKVPKELSEIIESKVYVEGDNPLFGEGHSQILVSIKNGKVNGLKHKFGSTITVLSAQIDQGGGGGTTVSKCDTEFINCIAACGPAPLDGSTNQTREECSKKCDAQYQLCKCQGGALSGSLTASIM